MKRLMMLAIAGMVLIALGCGSDEVKLNWTEKPWPDDYWMPVNGEVEIRFPYPCGTCDPGSALMLWHIATTADMMIDERGRVDGIHRPTPDALVAMCAVLADETVMAEAQARAAENMDSSKSPPDYMIPNPCETLGTPVPLESFTMMTQEELEEFRRRLRTEGSEASPPGYTRKVNEAVEIRYAYPALNYVWFSPMTIWHFPTSNDLHVDLNGDVVEDIGAPEPGAIEALCAVLNDEPLMEEVTSRAAETGAYWRYEPPVDPDPCEGLE
jgi:hypothetical protein